jgi:hypothetical protein
MTVLDPRKVDVADLLTLIRGISDRLDGIEGALGYIEDAVDAIRAASDHPAPGGAPKEGTT